MARYSATFNSVTTVATADTTNLANTSYPVYLQGGTATMRLNISEIYLGGEGASTSAPQMMKLARDSTVAATPAAGTTHNAVLDAANTAPGTTAVVGNSATTLPQRSSTLHLLNLTFNAYGGIVRWQARQGEEISTIGASASLGEVSLSAYTLTTPSTISGHVIYEVA